MTTTHEELQLNVLLNEYHACHRNRNHYDSIRWSIGSIFIAASLTVYGLSLDKDDPSVAVPLVLLSMFSILIWYAYFQHVNPWVMGSIERMQKIEDEIRKMSYKINLHNSIRNNQRIVRGTWITFILLLILSVAWIYKILLVYNVLSCASLLLYVTISGVIIYVFHFMISNKANWRLRINTA